MGPVCEKCKCNNHADTCHPKTGECITLQCIGGDCPVTDEGDPDDGLVPVPVDPVPGDPDPMVGPEVICHFRPDLCEQNTTVQVVPPVTLLIQV